VRAELLDVVNNRRQQGLWRQFTVSAQRFHEALFSEFLFAFTE
jgi:hypothetical protein